MRLDTSFGEVDGFSEGSRLGRKDEIFFVAGQGRAWGRGKTCSGSRAKLRNYICGDTVGADQLELVAVVTFAKARCSAKIG